MLKNHSVKDLYPLALAEGEGMGTAYEYFVKRMALGHFLTGMSRPQSVLIAGLPQKYGASLDFVLLATEIGARLTVVDDRSEALARLSDSLAALERVPGAPRLTPPAAVAQMPLDTLPALTGRFDLAVGSEVLQRLAPAERVDYIGRLRQLAPALAIFCPNADNEAHNTHSGLAGLTLEELEQLVASGAGGRVQADFIDMPPFPPGITRSAEQRDDATSGRFEAAVMAGLGVYARAERLIPRAIRRRQAHIVYALCRD